MGTNYYYVTLESHEKMGAMVHIGKASWPATGVEFKWAIDPVILAHYTRLSTPRIVIRDEYDNVITLAAFLEMVMQAKQSYDMVDKVFS